ncbi:hypothetical protein FVE85_8607 [Porphyridium purpureum]|uniref:Uncharacterized protein n=1 Tax=Porphyridium purpureum TaxID=35688 RepID=A0A5J4YQU8_PORPP|nr:hypothetical protein FVE85_8607 [Porphyridium purpureum]|eukprot:POR3884..scf296_7
MVSPERRARDPGLFVKMGDSSADWDKQASSAESKNSSSSFDMEEEMAFGEPGEMVFGEDLEETSSSARYWRKMDIAEELKVERLRKRYQGMHNATGSAQGTAEAAHRDVFTSSASGFFTPPCSLTWSEVTPDPLSQTSSVSSALITVGPSRDGLMVVPNGESLRRSSNEIDLLGGSALLLSRMSSSSLASSTPAPAPATSTAAPSRMAGLASAASRTRPCPLVERSSSGTGRPSGLFWKAREFRSDHSTQVPRQKNALHVFGWSESAGSLTGSLRPNPAQHSDAFAFCECDAEAPWAFNAQMSISRVGRAIGLKS